MENFFTFDTTQIGYYFLILFSGFITFLILGRNLNSIVLDSYKFNHRYFYLGVVTSLLSTIVLMNWQITDQTTYDVEEINPDMERIVMPVTVWPKPLIKLPPPPEPKLKLPKQLPKLINIKTVDNPSQVSVAKAAEPSYEPDLPQSIIAPAPPPMPEPIIEDEPDETPFMRVDQMPRFPGCEDIDGDLQAKAQCAEEQLLKYIYANVKFPAIAKEQGISGMALVQFVVEKDGTIGHIKVIRDPGAGLGNSVKKVVESMNELTQRWTAGKQKGRPVRVLFTLPVKFQLR